MSREITEYVDWEAHSSSSPDDHGNTTDRWAAPVRVGIWVFDPGSSSEPRVAGQDRVVVQPTIYMPAGNVFGPDDRIKVRGETYEVEGETREWRHRGVDRGNVVTLRRVDG